MGKIRKRKRTGSNHRLFMHRVFKHGVFKRRVFMRTVFKRRVSMPKVSNAPEPKTSETQTSEPKVSELKISEPKVPEPKISESKVASESKASESKVVSKSQNPPWPPEPPDMVVDDIIDELECPPLRMSTKANFYRLKGQRKAYKTPTSQHEIDLMAAAGGCAVKVHSRCFWKDDNGDIDLHGIIIDLEKVFVPRDVAPSYRSILAEEMMIVVHKLHQRGVTHGDVKPANFSVRPNWTMCLYEFTDGVRRGEPGTGDWVGQMMTKYLSPNRVRSWPKERIAPPTVKDDLYALGLCIWKLFTGKTPFYGYKSEDDIIYALQRGEMVNLDEVDDEDMKETIRGYLRCGGANV